MPVISADHSVEDRSVTLVSQFSAPPERVWQVWADPRQLERWWGPPSYPATVTRHEWQVGGRVDYYMTSPEGEKFGGWWEIVALDEPHSITFRDGFADGEGNPVDSAPVSSSTVRLEAHDGGTRMTVLTSYASVEDLQTVLDMGMLDGATAAGNQIDALLAG